MGLENSIAVKIFLAIELSITGLEGIRDVSIILIVGFQAVFGE